MATIFRSPLITKIESRKDQNPPFQPNNILISTLGLPIPKPFKGFVQENPPLRIWDINRFTHVHFRVHLYPVATQPHFGNSQELPVWRNNSVLNLTHIFYYIQDPITPFYQLDWPNPIPRTINGNDYNYTQNSGTIRMPLPPKPIAGFTFENPIPKRYPIDNYSLIQSTLFQYAGTISGGTTINANTGLSLSTTGGEIGSD